jgi:hypothetical protein
VVVVVAERERKATQTTTDKRALTLALPFSGPPSLPPSLVLPARPATPLCPGDEGGGVRRDPSSLYTSPTPQGFLITPNPLPHLNARPCA